MRLYDIDVAIRKMVEDAVDPDTGEVLLDEEALAALQLERDKKIEGIGLLIKELDAEGSAIRAEEVALAKRRKTKENQRDRLKAFLLGALDGQKFETARVRLTCRLGPEKANLTDEDGLLMWALDAERDDLLRYKTPEPDKKKILEALRRGEDIPGAEITRDYSLMIK